MLLNADATITILSNGNPADVPLSANGALTISAPNIRQGGVVRAPAGQITLTNATVTLATNQPGGDNTKITLLPGSVTSVDLDGSLVPYGRTRNGIDWLFGNIANGTAPQKLVTLAGPNIDVQAGALVTSSGGGDLATFEFVPGPGGSKDVLAGLNTFAIIPSYRGALPKDIDWGQTSLQVGNSVYLSGIPGLAAGVYTLLPGHYALLPGAFRVTLNAASSDQGASTNTRTATGAYLAAGYLVDQFTGARASGRWSTFLVTPGDVVRTQTQFNEPTTGDFSSPRRPRDGRRRAAAGEPGGSRSTRRRSDVRGQPAHGADPRRARRAIDISSGGKIKITGRM